MALNLCTGRWTLAFIRQGHDEFGSFFLFDLGRLFFPKFVVYRPKKGSLLKKSINSESSQKIWNDLVMHLFLTQCVSSLLTGVSARCDLTKQEQHSTTRGKPFVPLTNSLRLESCLSSHEKSNIKQLNAKAAHISACRSSTFLRELTRRVGTCFFGTSVTHKIYTE